MAEEAETTPAPATPKKGGKKSSGAKPKKAKSSPSHPKVSVMVPAAIAALKERGGSSLQAIKKYVAANYKVDVERLAPFIKKYLKSAVESGALVQKKGKGATGSFQLKGSAPKTSEGNPTKGKKAKAPRAKSATAKKSAAKPKAPAAEKKPKAKKSPKKPAKKASAKPKAAKKAAKPKAPKPKKAAKSTKKTGKK